ncbi:16S rRNA (cytosine(1402)-N(4))-methyltransferase RsmH, partial [bacterium]|nr:16S rRNA (cytosine(1402)-N(4))-methyltransferase RsmH [bacterium]
MNEPAALHLPVMEREIVEFMPILDEPFVMVDCTIGFGGHSAALTRHFQPEDHLVGLDRDENALAHCRKQFGEAPFPVTLIHSGFDQVDERLEQEGIQRAHYILFDIGFSSPQVDRADRGFSFTKDGPLDMRMDQTQPITAAGILASWDDRALADLFKNYGDERFARKIAKAIVRRRREEPIETTQELADVVLNAIPDRYQHQEGIHPATRVFQALRIEVNDELNQLRKGLEGGLKRLARGGRLAVLSYHSLEHRIVKEWFRRYGGQVGPLPGPE